MSGCLSDSILKAFGAVVCRSCFAVENLTLGTKLLNLEWDWGGARACPSHLCVPLGPLRNLLEMPVAGRNWFGNHYFKQHETYELTVTGPFSRDESLLVYIIRIVGNLLLCPWDKRLNL